MIFDIRVDTLLGISIITLIIACTYAYLHIMFSCMYLIVIWQTEPDLPTTEGNHDDSASQGKDKAAVEPAELVFEVDVGCPCWTVVRWNSSVGSASRYKKKIGGAPALEWGDILMKCLTLRESQNPKVEVLYHIRYIRPYFVGIFPYIRVTQALYMVGACNSGT